MSFPAAQAIVRQKHQAKTHPSLGNSPFPVELTVLQCCLQQLACRSFAASHFVSHIPTKRCRTSKQRATLFLQNNTAVCPVFTDISQKHPRSCKDSFGGEAKMMCPSHSFHWERFHDPLPPRTRDMGQRGHKGQRTPVLEIPRTHCLAGWFGHAWFLSRNC